MTASGCTRSASPTNCRRIETNGRSVAGRVTARRRRVTGVVNQPRGLRARITSRSPADVLTIDRHAEEDDRHLVGRPLAPAHRTRRAARLTWVPGRVVEHGDHVDPRAGRQWYGLCERVLPLPVEVPVVDVNER